jgi:pSer/pThr/pTyr-binding forkhead associated (FHA) protein
MPHFLIRSTELADRRLPLPGKVLVIGRSLDADVPVRHASVSRRHALLEEKDGGYVISDLGSSNGTFVEELRVYPAEKAVVRIGQVFRVGEVRILLAPDEVLDEELPAVAPPSRRAPRGDGSLTLAPAPKVTPPRPGASDSPRAGRKPRPALKARIQQRKAKQAITRAAMFGLTVVLLSLAAFFVYRIIDNRSRNGPLALPEDAGVDAAAKEDPKPPEKEPVAAPIIVDEDR